MGRKNAVGEYEIRTADDLVELCDRVASGDDCKGLVFRQEADIDLSTVLRHTPDGSWSPIGNSTRPFCGRYVGEGTDGTLHVISGMHISKCAQSYIGLFGYLGREAQIEKIFLKGAEIKIAKGYCYIGGLAGVCLGKIENCAVTGEIQSEGQEICAGGLAGLLESSGAICSSFYDGKLSAAGNSFAAGGLVGSSMGEISYCYQHGEVMGAAKEKSALPMPYNPACANYVGGITGENGKRIFRCYNLGKVRGEGAQTGGITGFCKTLEEEISASVENCFYWEKAVEEESAFGTAVSLRELLSNEFLGKLDAERAHFMPGMREEQIKCQGTPFLSCFDGKEICREDVLISTMCIDMEFFKVRTAIEGMSRQPVSLDWSVLNGEWAKLLVNGEWIDVRPDEEGHFVQFMEGEREEIFLQSGNRYCQEAAETSLIYQTPMIESFEWRWATNLSGNFFLPVHDAEGFLEPGLVASERGKTIHFELKGGGGGGSTHYEFSWHVNYAVKVILIVNEESYEFVSGETEMVLKVDSVRSAALIAEDEYGYQVERTGRTKVHETLT